MSSGVSLLTVLAEWRVSNLLMQPFVSFVHHLFGNSFVTFAALYYIPSTDTLFKTKILSLWPKTMFT